MAGYQGIFPKFSENSCGANIELETESTSAKWNFCKSQGLAFSGFCLHDNRVFEAIFKGSGHARIGLTQIDPDHITDLQEAIRRNQILFVSDVRFHKRECVVGIVKSVQGNGCKFETRFQGNDPQIKDLVAGNDVWIVFFLKFGEYTVQIRDNAKKNTLKFHRKRDTNVSISNDLLSMKLLYPFPFAYACAENVIEIGHGIKFSVEPKEEDGKKPKQFHFRVGVSSRKASSAESLDFAPVVSEKLEKDECLGEFTACISHKSKFHLHRKGSCIFSRTISNSVNLKSPLYVCFEIFRVRVLLLETQYCTHTSDAVENSEPSDENEDFPYANMVKVQGVMQHILLTGTITEDDKSKIRSITPGLAEYVNHSSVVSLGVEKEGYLTPVNSSEMRNIIQMMESINADNAAKMENVIQKIQTILDIVNRLLMVHEPATSGTLTNRQFQEHLRTTCADFIQSVDTFPLCDHLFQFGIINQAQYDKLQEEFKRCRQDANRDLFNILRRREHNSDQLRSIRRAFAENKQEHLLPNLHKGS